MDITKYEKYIRKFDLTGGGAWCKYANSRYLIIYIAREPKHKIWLANIILFVWWLKDIPIKRRRKNV